MDKTFAKKLKEARARTGLSQQGMADRMLISKRNIEKWETGERVPPEYVQRFLLNELENLTKEKTSATPEEKRRKVNVEERHRINTYAPLEKLEEIAKGHVPALTGRQNGLDTMNSDELDFCEVSVWGLKEALIEAYLLGTKDGYRDAEAKERENIRKMKQMMASHEKWKASHPRKGKEG